MYVIFSTTEKENFIEHCMKSKSNNIFPCPEKVLKEIKEQRIIDRQKRFKRIMKMFGKLLFKMFLITTYVVSKYMFLSSMHCINMCP